MPSVGRRSTRAGTPPGDREPSRGPAHGRSPGGGRAVPEAAVARLPLYLRVLAGVAESGQSTISSESLARLAGVTGAKVRKDLSHLGSYGTRGVGYDVEYLLAEVSRALGLERRWAVAIVGLGNLGQALAGYAGFTARGLRVVALFDADPDVVGTRVHGLLVRPVAELAETCRREGVQIAVITVPAARAQAVCDELVAAGVTGVLNFAPVTLDVPGHVNVRKADLALELQILAFHEQRRAATSVPRPAAKVPVAVR